MVWLALLAMAPRARAPAPPAAIYPHPAPADLASTTRLAAEAQGVSGPEARLACRVLAPHLSLCFDQAPGADLTLVTEADLLAWGHDAAWLDAQARQTALAGLTDHRPTPTPVPGMTGTYWVSAEADGLDAAGLLYPERLAQIAGAPVVVAVPVSGALLFWVPGDPAFDEVMAVGVARLYQSSDQRVSSKLYRWDGARWVVYGEAVLSGAPAGSTPVP